MENGTVYAYLENNPEAGRLKLLRGIAAGLEYLHNQQPGIVHGDLCADNVLVSDQGVPCLADFGLSRVLEEICGMTTTSELAGSVRWMSPKLLQADCKTTVQSDIWAFAMTILEVMTGERPYSSVRSDLIVLGMVRDGLLPPRPEYSGLREEIDDYMWAGCQRCWAAEPRERLFMTEMIFIIDGKHSQVRAGKRARTVIEVEEHLGVNENGEDGRLSQVRAEKRARTVIEVKEHLGVGVDESAFALKQVSSAHANPTPDRDGYWALEDESFMQETDFDDLVGPVTLLQGHEAEVFSAVWNPAHPNLLASGSKDATAWIWSWDDVKVYARDYAPPDFSFVTSPHDSYFPRPRPLVLRHSPKSDQPDITSLDWNVDGTLLATGSYDCLLRIWRVSGELYMMQIHHSGLIFSVKFSWSGKWLLSASLDGTVSVWDVFTKKLAMQYKIHTSCLDVDWLDDSMFVTCSVDHVLHLVSLYSHEAILTFIGHKNEVNQVKFNKHGTLLASCSDDHTAQIWFSDAWTNPDGSVVYQKSPGIAKEQPAMKYHPKFVLRGHGDSVGAVRWCPADNGAPETLLATCSFDTTARLWDASKGVCLRVFTGSTSPLFSITFSPEGKFIATGSEDGHLYIYNAATRDKVWQWPATGPGVGPIYDVNWQKTGGRRLAMCLKAKVVGVVDTDKIPELKLSPISSQ